MSAKFLLTATLISITLHLIISASSDTPEIYTVVRPWLHHTYLFFIVNAIIIVVIVFSSLHHTHSHEPIKHGLVGYVEELKELITCPSTSMSLDYGIMAEEVPPPFVSLMGQEVDFSKEHPSHVSRFGHQQQPRETSPIAVKDIYIDEVNEIKEVEIDSLSAPSPPHQSLLLRQEMMAADFSSEQLVSQEMVPVFSIERLSIESGSRFGPRQIKSDGMRRVAKPKRQDTTMVNEDRNSAHVSYAIELRKDPSLLDHDELNHRVEAFINEFKKNLTMEK